MAIDRDPMETAKRAMDTDPSLAAFILSKTAAAFADDDIARMAYAHWRNGCSKGDVLGLIRDIEAWEAAKAAQVTNAR